MVDANTDAGLDLRCRPGRAVVEPAPVRAFGVACGGKARSGAGPARGLAFVDGVDELVARLMAGRPLPGASSQTIPLFLRDEAPAIPVPGQPLAEAEAFDLALVEPGRLAFVQLLPTGVGRGAVTAVTVMATCISLVIPTGAALAHGPADAAPAAEASTAQPAPTVSTAAPAVSEGPAPQTRAPSVSSGGVFTTLLGEDLALSMRDGATFRGRLLAVQGEWLVCARLDDGRVVAVLQSEVAQVHAVQHRPSASDKVAVFKDTGAGRIGAGAGLIGGGVTMTIGTIWGGIYYSAYPYIILPLILPAVVMFATGIPLFIRGQRMHRKFEASMAGQPRASLRPRRKVEWDGGLRLRF